MVRSILSPLQFCSFLFDTSKFEVVKSFKMKRNICKKMLILMFALNCVHQVKNWRAFSFLAKFTCAVVKDEFEKNPEMQTIAIIELENYFPSIFSWRIIQCLPDEVAKLIINPHYHIDFNNTIVLPRESMIIYLGDIDLLV